MTSVLDSVLMLYRALWRYAKGHRVALLTAAMLLLGSELMRLLLPWLAGSAVNVLQAEGRQGLQAAGVLLAQLFGVVVVAWVCHAKGRVLERNVALSVRQAFALELMHRLLRAPLAWHRKEHPVALTQRAMQGTGALNDFAESQWIYLQGCVQIFGPLVALCLISPWVGALGAAGVALLVTVSLSFDRVQLHLIDVKNAADRHNASTWADVLAHFLTVQALRLHRGVMAMARSRLTEIFQPLRRLVFVNEIKWGAMDILGTLLWISLVVVHVLQVAGGAPSAPTAGGAAAAIGGGIALGSVFMVYEYARKAENSMNVLAGDFAILAGQLSGFRAVQSLLAAPQTEIDNAVVQATDWQLLALHRVGFQFPTGPADGVAAKKALHGIDLQLRRRGRYAVVGASGAGKTALLTLLAGLESPSEGSVSLDGLAVSSAALRREATLVPNQVAVFEGSVRENVQPGGEDIVETAQSAAMAAPADAARAWQVLETVGLKEFIGSLPQSVHTVVGEGKAGWSTGQQQRLALARGVLAAAGSSMLLLDEPTSHLDPGNARQVLASVLESFSSSCIVVSLHDLSLLPYFDEVIVMQDGCVVDMGETTRVRARCALLNKLLTQPRRMDTMAATDSQHELTSQAPPGARADEARSA